MEDWRELLPTAYLLTGSDAAARDLLARGLARGPGLDDLVRAHLRRRLGRDSALTGTSSDPWWLSGEDVDAAARTATALDVLTRTERTAVVLRWHEGLPDDRVARLVPGVDLSTLTTRVGIPAGELPGRLEGLAALTDLRDLTDDDVARGVRELRGRRRSRGLLAVGVVAVLGAGAVWLPDALPTAPPAATTTPSAPGPQAPESGPARGSLVDDEEFVADLRARLDPDQDDGRLLYAGDAAGTRWALLVRGDGDGLTTYWFVGSEGAPVADLVQLSDSYGAVRPAAWSALASLGDRSALLVVAEPDDEVQLSDGFVVAPDGTAGREFDPVDVEDGVAVVALEGARSRSAVVYRVLRDGDPAATESPSATTTRDLTWTALADGVRARSGSSPVDQNAYETAVVQITGPTGLDPADVDVTILGAGSYPAPGGGTAQAVTVAVVLPGGAVATATAWTAVDGYDLSAGSCGVETHPAGTDPGALTVVTRCASYAGDSSTFGATVLVATPPGTAVTLDSGAGGQPRTPDLADGWGYLVDGVDDLTQFAASGTNGEISRAGSGPFDHF